ncbi:hypothetical protein [Chlorobium phaeovibrioides]|uniref:Uncharacterized protein n=1 Tax=Chlorobium phaeovibrioides TaxID=1094 RepID=A0A432ATF6_CHLPH|nr:hypothetical protein [Chlorobium phaeovibrioides]KAA6231876.1 hypothetical protein FP507_01240 [Chlorobium phaeovibrioides]MWV53493.1 hypothetical protein [Chlorobium phaeovibrioides]QEQ57568.1 hypothetical protein FNV82_08520 [Chlorobium phaeovibrioides]RTY36251.1 hypothetical protein EKD02_08330 [Chlorobium phaeovibrioides]
MGKANKQGNNPKRRVKVRVLNVLMILAGADLILLLSPGAGILNSLFFIPDIYTWPALGVGLLLLFAGLRDLYREEGGAP